MTIKEKARILTYELPAYYMDTDTTDSCAWLLEQVPYNFARFERFGFHLQNEEYTQASVLLNAIVPENSLEELTRNYYRTVLEIYTQPSFNFRLTETQMQTIGEMASKGGSRYDKMGLNYAAKSLLIFFMGKDYKIRKENYDGEEERRQEHEVLTGLSLFPNPSEGTLTVRASEQTFYLKLIGVTGQVVLDRFIGSGETLNLSQLPAGVYTVKLFNGEKVEHAKWVKQ